MMPIYTTQQDGERLDLICWRWYGTLSGRAVERVLAVNPGLARRGPHALPAGTVISLPALAKSSAPGPRVF